jgi:hypothetical protein
VSKPGPPEFLTFIAALLAQTGIVVAIVRTTVYFIYKKEYTPPEPCGGKLVMPYNDESKFTDAMIHWNIARTAWDLSEQRRLAEVRKEVKRMESFSGLTTFSIPCPSLPEPRVHAPSLNHGPAIRSAHGSPERSSSRMPKRCFGTSFLSMSIAQ